MRLVWMWLEAIFYPRKEETFISGSYFIFGLVHLCPNLKLTGISSKDTNCVCGPYSRPTGGFQSLDS